MHGHIFTPFNHNPIMTWPYNWPGSGGGSIRYFVLAEDAAAMPVYAWPGVLLVPSGDILVDIDATEPFELYHWMDVLRSPKQAKAGYAGVYGTDDSGRSVFLNGPCIGGCQTDSSISPGEPMDGEVGEPYTHAVGSSGLGEGGISASGLPPGLTINTETGVIAGTPTQAGEYWVTLMADSNDSPPCPITRIVRITIGESEPGGGGSPGAEPEV